jgi:hypothetical protein
MAEAYKAEGWDKLSYIRYAIKIAEPTNDQVADTDQIIAAQRDSIKEVEVDPYWQENLATLLHNR